MIRLAVLLLVVACVVPLEAQVLYGSLVGNVSDPSQAVVLAAKVTVTNTGTG